ncbi:aspartate aminotransferase family protein [Aliagarivorans taiwanensis]|uniref:aspartate aminotransferase family protein n=1 Tax=Aliagarivorans taiwanensis TaxID=561966 RepID=UPI0004286BC0|nr:aspartate aminotransferase family protein [Aliagarivorans taiwanensis]
MSHVFQRHCHHALPIASQGDGIYLIDSQGKRYLDACGGAAVSSLGHSHPAIREALHKQIDQLAFAHTGFFSNHPAEALAEFLADKAPGQLEYCYFVSGGSEAMESALKLARQYFVERGETQRKRFIARRQSYHGNTLGALAVGGNQWRRAPFSPLLMEAEHIAPCYAYRDKLPDESDSQYGKRVANELEQRLLEVGPESVIAFVAEPVVGATAGALPAVEGYFKRVREICDHYGILLILDEVMCGMGRCGEWFTHAAEGIEADIVAVAKGLGAGYQPVGATIVSRDIYHTVASGTGYFQHGHTYLAHACAMQASLSVMQTIEQQNLLGAVKQQGEYLQQQLRKTFSGHPHVGDIRGRGLFWGLELVADRASKTPFPASNGLDKKIKASAFAKGLMCYPNAGTIDGQNGHHILLAPPFIIEQAQIDTVVATLSECIDQQTRMAAAEKVA